MLLEIKDLVYEASDRVILNHINLKVDKGETIAIIGPSGSGKSTFQKLICNLISPTSGTLYFKVNHMMITNQKYYVDTLAI